MDSEQAKEYRRNLRKNQTDAERVLWTILRNGQLKGVKFRRQHSLGKYIVDFYAAAIKLAIEIDGGQHYVPENRVYDEARTRELALLGVRVVRFTNTDVLQNLDGVYQRLHEIVCNMR